MASFASVHMSKQLALSALLFLLLVSTGAARRSRRSSSMNVIDRCWRLNPHWAKYRQQLATCSVGFAGKMRNNMGRGLIRYTVTDPTDEPIRPRPGTLRYGATLIKGKVWINFRRNMQIKLQKPLLISSFTTIDARGANVHIAHGSCLLLYKVSNVIIHGLHIHHCRKPVPGPVIGPGSKIIDLGTKGGDGVALMESTKIWIDHNTLYACSDGLVDVTRGSTDVTISNNWFKNHDKVMLLGHDDEYVRDKKMRVTVVFNRFGPNCNQRMPRVRYGYAHVANNFYQGWGEYAIGGSMNPSITSEANLFVAPKSGNKVVTWRLGDVKTRQSWNWRSVNDKFLNGAFFKQTGSRRARGPRYNREQRFAVGAAKAVRSFTRSAGAFGCFRFRC